MQFLQSGEAAVAPVSKTVFDSVQPCIVDTSAVVPFQQSRVIVSSGKTKYTFSLVNGSPGTQTELISISGIQIVWLSGGSVSGNVQQIDVQLLDGGGLPLSLAMTTAGTTLSTSSGTQQVFNFDLGKDFGGMILGPDVDLLFAITEHYAAGTTNRAGTTTATADVVYAQ